MEFSKFYPLDKPVSRFIVGTMNLVDNDDITQLEPDFKRLDAALERGITTIDTAMGYGRGTTESALGKFFQSRGNRNEFFLISKCSHPGPWRTRVHPFDMSADLHDALVKMKTDYIDMYLMHRDDPTQPVGPIVDRMNEFIREGKIGAWGVSNWTIERIEAANSYALATGQQRIAVSSPNYSLAQQYNDPWAPGCLTISGPENADNQAWYAANQMPVLAYSSMARGLFSGRITRKQWIEHPEEIDAVCLKAYCGETNFTRLERCLELAAKKGCSIPQIAMAFVLCCPMNVFPIIGAANAAEMDSSLAALDCKLTAEEVAYLDLKS